MKGIDLLQRSQSGHMAAGVLVGRRDLTNDTLRVPKGGHLRILIVDHYMHMLCTGTGRS